MNNQTIYFLYSKDTQDIYAVSILIEELEEIIEDIDNDLELFEISEDEEIDLPNGNTVDYEAVLDLVL